MQCPQENGKRKVRHRLETKANMSALSSNVRIAISGAWFTAPGLYLMMRRRLTLTSEDLIGKVITVEEGGAQYTTKVEKVKAADSSTYWVVYLTIKATGKKSKKKSRWVDLELPPSEKAMSWWRVDGYDTDPATKEDGEDDNEDEYDEEEEEEEDEPMDVDKEE